MNYALITPRPEAERVSDRVAEQLLEMIANGTVAPGERLPGERQLAQQMGVSRVSVRAALQTLKTRGLLSAVQGGGTRVMAISGQVDCALVQLTRLNYDNLHDLMQMRVGMEEWTARQAAQNAQPEHIAEMDDSLTVMARINTRPAQKNAEDMRFHLAVAKASGSAVYMHMISVLRDILEQSLTTHRIELYASTEDELVLLEQHRAIARAIANRAPDDAARAMRRHLEWVAARYKLQTALAGHA